MSIDTNLQAIIKKNVCAALKEDIGSGDITANLIPSNQQANAQVITRQAAVICGIAWVDEVFRQVDPSLCIDWQVKDGDQVTAEQVLFNCSGSASSLLTAERCALNFLQTLSGTATISQRYADLVKDTQVKLLDTRKTIPGLRAAQKYAVTCGGCFNHRIGLFDAFLIKENHIMACGGIANAIRQAHNNAPGKKVEIEVETLQQLKLAVQGNADIVMLDNFSLELMRQAVDWTAGRVKLEASGNISSETLLATAKTGVDYISIGALTKHCHAVDLSMRFN
ncbi:MAG: nicotinate-nucleotide pyrophosphorylase [Osedax symbiont Rs1]|nr:MAG: nicotinate-nucleotide pyrophosphorylase [Osedax symbiont Rs1]